MPRRANHEGSIYRRQDGRWAASICIGRQRITVYAKTRQEAADKLRQLQRQSQLPNAGKLTLGEYLTTWLEQASQRLRPKTLADYRRLVERHIAPQPIAAMRLTKLTGLRLATCYTQLAKAGVSAFVRRQVHALLHKALADAVKWGLLVSNPASGVDKPKPQPQERQLWTAEQVATFLAAVDGQYADLFAFLLASGCRLGEALGLRWSDVDWPTGTVCIQRQVTEVNGRPVEGPPKSKAGVRRIALPTWGLAALERQQARVRQWQLQSDNAFASGWQRCFPTPKGTVPEASNLRRAFLAVCDRLGLPRVRLHDLRHISLSLLAQSGISVKDLQRRAGHSSPTLTLQVYVHASQDGDRRAAAVLENLQT